MTSYILVFAAQEIYAACVMIWNVLPPSRPPTVFRFSADQINVFVRCTFFGSRSPSAVHRRPLVLDYAPSLSGVSQLLSVCFPADSLFRLQRGATPVAACLQAPAELCKAVAAAPHTFGNRLLVFPSCQNIIVLVGGVVLPPPHAASGTDRLARFPSCKACQSPPRCPWLKRFHTLPVRLHAAIRACLRCLLPAGTALHSQFFSGNIFTPSPSCRLRSISACRAKGTPTIERIINAFVPRKAFCSSALMQTLEQVSGRSPHRFK